MSRAYIGASEIDHYCYRYLWNCLNGIQRKYSEKTQEIFALGHKIEPYVLANLSKKHHIWGTQNSYSLFDGKIKGHIDGFIDWKDQVHVLEIKGLNSKNFRDVALQTGELYEKYLSQVQVYMHLTGLPRALLFAVNKELIDMTQDLKDEHTIALSIAADPAHALRLIENATMVFDCSDPPVPIEDFRCKMCCFREACEIGQNKH